MGDPSPAALAHLATCEECSTRRNAIAEPLASFRKVSLAWSERRSATLPLREESFGSATASPSWLRRHGWLAATAAVVTAMLAVPMHFSNRQPDAQTDQNRANAAIPATGATSRPSAATPPQASSDDLRRQRQIDADNQMLAAIDHELDASQAKLAAYGLSVSAGADASPSRTRSRNHAGAPAQD
jgi:negative regulator of sigma E activity